MSWLPWRLEYTKQGIDFAVKKAADAAAEAKKTAPPDEPPKKKTKAPKIDRASADQQEQARNRLLVEKQFREVVLPANGAYFNQGAYKNVPFPKISEDPKTSTRTLKSGGCGPTALAIAVATLRPDSHTTPREVAKFALDKGYSSPRSNPDGRGADMSMTKLVAKDHGLTSVKIKTDAKDKMDKLVDGLRHHGVAVVHVGPGVFNDRPKKKATNGHWIAVNGYAVDKDGNEWFFVANPGAGDPLRDFSADYLKDKGVIVENDLHHGAGKVRVSRAALEELMKEAYMVTDPAASPAAP